MKANLHPKWYPEARAVCACGNTWTVGATIPEFKTDVCSKCHPFFTGEQRIVDTEGQVDRFISRLKAREDKLREAEQLRAPRTAPEMDIARLGLSAQLQKTLRAASVNTAQDVFALLAQGGDEALTNVKGVGLKALADLKKALRAQGFVLPGDQAESAAA